EPDAERVRRPAHLERDGREVDFARGAARPGAPLRHRRPVVDVVHLALIVARQDGAHERRPTVPPAEERLHRLVDGMPREEGDHVPVLAAKEDVEGLDELEGHGRWPPGADAARAYGDATTACALPRP